MADIDNIYEWLADAPKYRVVPLAGIAIDAHGIPLWVPLDAVQIHDGDVPQVSESHNAKGPQR